MIVTTHDILDIKFYNNVKSFSKVNKLLHKTLLCTLVFVIDPNNTSNRLFSEDIFSISAVIMTNLPVFKPFY